MKKRQKNTRGRKTGVFLAPSGFQPAMRCYKGRTKLESHKIFSIFKQILLIQFSKHLN